MQADFLFKNIQFCLIVFHFIQSSFETLVGDRDTPFFKFIEPSFANGFDNIFELPQFPIQLDL